MATALATPFYLDMGYSKTEIGSVAKFAGLWASDRRRHHRRRRHAETEHQPGTVAVRARAAPHHHPLYLAEPGGAYAYRTVRRRQRRVPRCRPRNGRAHRLHGERNQQGVYSHSVCSVLKPHRRSSHLGECDDRLHRRSRGLDPILRHLHPPRGSRHADAVEGRALDRRSL